MALMLKLESEHFHLRTLVPEDASRDWGNWLADPATAAALNAVPRTLSEADRLQYINSMDNQTAYLLGIFEKASGDMIGIWTIYVDPASKEYLLNVLVSPDGGRNQGGLTETREPIYRHFFNELGLEAARLNVMASNTYVLGRLVRQAWKVEHRSHTRLAGTEALTEVVHLRMTKTVWADYMARLAAEAG
jgi:RimJ/RimL family protein N-acetyltransferase